MTTDLRSRTQYLSLALFSEQVIRTLLDYLEKGCPPTKDGPLYEALLSLEHVSQDQSLTPMPRKAAFFNSYEHLRTRDEVWDEKDKELAIRTLKSLAGSQATPLAQHDARELMSLFVRLGNQARWNFDQPSPTTPRRIMELCQVP